MASRLDSQITQLEENLKLHKLAVRFHSQKVVSITHKNLSSPTALWCAAGTGFLVGKITDRPKRTKAAGKEGSRTKLVVNVLRVIAGVQTANSFAKHL
ncbi:hypothetical protein SAMN06297229_2262 [Pseudidiomarina planktonica]|uniref:Uncharacterized protein n=1 Tax=Pseudidiomarina planktonica TaxID=1323738 RepID=A0A1Y6FXB8_9GAMM|nr:hypothetical protein [Pseudidiomarina planktonica]RUO63279.1 hypothetical protein CWI77_10530 [Pseudidiomarina planktonica]SMQ80505.1 hypothetical protein SAMN06297229_2262 [Pseudidiomarina planktonica]